jgi:hypothetical protein
VVIIVKEALANGRLTARNAAGLATGGQLQLLQDAAEEVGVSNNLLLLGASP